MSNDYAAFKELHALLSAGQSRAAMASLRSLQARVIALHDEVERLHERIGDFEDILSVRRKLARRNGLLWLEANGREAGPFCPACHGAGSGLVRLRGHFGEWTCPCCTERFGNEEAEVNERGERRSGTRVLQFQPGLGS